jgi:hypothetical protein
MYEMARRVQLVNVIAMKTMYEMARRVQLVNVIAMKTNTFPFNNRRPRDLQAKPWGQSPSHRPRDASSPLAV